MKNLTALMISLLATLGLAHAGEPLGPGMDAPQLTAPNQAGEPVDLGALFAKGATLVYFYPKADTPGCTKQACNLRDNHAAFTEKGIRVIGVSHDTADAQKRFQEKYSLPFVLIADADGKVADAFGTARLVGGMTQRQSFLIKDGKVVWNDLKAKPDSHVANVLAAFEAMPKS